MRLSSAARPAIGTRTRRISSVAYAVDEIASDANTARAVGLPRRCPSSSVEASGRPTTSRFSAEYGPATDGSGRLLPNVERDADHDGVGAEEQPRLEAESRLVVEGVLPPSLDEELGDDHADHVVGHLLVDLVEE